MTNAFLSLRAAALAALLGTSAAAQTPPTATEAFNLRIKCKQLAEEKANALIENETATRRPTEFSVAASGSNYDAKANRCYAEITSHLKWGNKRKMNERCGRCTMVRPTTYSRTRR